jgi:hypothetical protein
MKRLGHAPPGFQGFRAETARRGNVRSQSNNWEIDHAGNHRGVQDLGEGEALVFVEGIDLLSDSVSGTLGHGRIADPFHPEFVLVAGHPIARFNPSDEADHLFLADVRHLGTVGQGLLATLLVATINAEFAAGLPPLSGRKILDFAAIRSPTSRRESHTPTAPDDLRRLSYGRTIGGFFRALELP